MERKNIYRLAFLAATIASCGSPNNPQEPKSDQSFGEHRSRLTEQLRAHPPAAPITPDWPEAREQFVQFSGQACVEMGTPDNDCDDTSDYPLPNVIFFIQGHNGSEARVVTNRDGIAVIEVPTEEFVFLNEAGHQSASYIIGVDAYATNPFGEQGEFVCLSQVYSDEDLRELFGTRAFAVIRVLAPYSENDCHLHDYHAQYIDTN